MAFKSFFPYYQCPNNESHSIEFVPRWSSKPYNLYCSICKDVNGLPVEVILADAPATQYSRAVFHESEHVPPNTFVAVPRKRVMTELPILFSGSMVRAILDGKKTQTRRVITSAYRPNKKPKLLPELLLRMGIGKACPYGVVGDRLWVRETICNHNRYGMPLGIHPQIQGTKKYPERAWSYAADKIDIDSITRCRPSIFMPRWASRLTLEITDVRVQRVSDISKEDAIAEGIQVFPLQSQNDESAWYQSEPGVNQARTAQQSFRLLWDSINFKRHFGWDKNPWVWAVSFKIVPQGTH